MTTGGYKFHVVILLRTGGQLIDNRYIIKKKTSASCKEPVMVF